MHDMKKGTHRVPFFVPEWDRRREGASRPSGSYFCSMARAAAFGRIFLGIAFFRLGHPTKAKQAILFDDAVDKIGHHLHPVLSAVLDGLQGCAAENGQHFRVEIVNVCDALVEGEVVVERLEARVDGRG